MVVKLMVKAFSGIMSRRYPVITCYQINENRYRVITRNGLGSEIVEDFGSAREMRESALARFDRLSK